MFYVLFAQNVFDNGIWSIKFGDTDYMQLCLFQMISSASWSYPGPLALLSSVKSYFLIALERITTDAVSHLLRGAALSCSKLFPCFNGTLFHSLSKLLLSTDTQHTQVLTPSMFTHCPHTAWLRGFTERLLLNVTQWRLNSRVNLCGLL